MLKLEKLKINEHITCKWLIKNQPSINNLN
jgi:hypothetical protein